MALLLLASHALTADHRCTLAHAALQLVYLITTMPASADILNPACHLPEWVQVDATTQQLLQRQVAASGMLAAVKYLLWQSGCLVTPPLQAQVQAALQVSHLHFMEPGSRPEHAKQCTGSSPEIQK